MWTQHSPEGLVAWMGAFARQLCGGLDQLDSELPEVVEVLAYPQQVEGGADDRIVPGEGLAHALDELTAVVVIARV
jgi:hypothetical protein